ncbi:MAG TPA: LapA family protein [Smithellaceae bacterium]|nr:LapA family protein [Smithellaceae bacterium]
MNFKIILVIILACLALVFVAQNIDIVSLKFFYWEIAMSRAVLIFFSLLIGFMIGWFLKSYLSYRKKKKEVQNILNK